MKTKKVLRLSNFKDYVAVDIIDETERILETPIYLQKNKPVILQGRNRDENLISKTEVTFNGEKLLCVDLDENSPDFEMDWDSPVAELLTEVYILPKT